MAALDLRAFRLGSPVYYVKMQTAMERIKSAVIG